VKIVALAGGVGAARLLSGLVRAMPPEDLTVVVNTGDDFYWMGLYICPDLDTVTYTLAGKDNPQTGWGVRDDSFRALDRLKELGCDTWFRVGDVDLATHLYRTEQLSCGSSLTSITQRIAEHNGIRCRILPMTDTPVPTLVETNEGTLLFQDYFVRRRCAPSVIGFTSRGIENAQASPGVLEALEESSAIIICPSNPFISIGPILSVPGLREALRRVPATILAVTPIVAGQAIKGPAAAMLEQMGLDVSAISIAKLYQDFLDVFVLDNSDRALAPRIAALGIQVQIANTLMNSNDARLELARGLLEMLS
jgi:LPPG:FO 2-phospho-L-lactate transferase